MSCDTLHSGSNASHCRSTTSAVLPLQVVHFFCRLGWDWAVHRNQTKDQVNVLKTWNGWISNTTYLSLYPSTTTCFEIWLPIDSTHPQIQLVSNTIQFLSLSLPSEHTTCLQVCSGTLSHSICDSPFPHACTLLPYTHTQVITVQNLQYWSSPQRKLLHISTTMTIPSKFLSRLPSSTFCLNQFAASSNFHLPPPNRFLFLPIRLLTLNVY